MTEQVTAGFLTEAEILLGKAATSRHRQSRPSQRDLEAAINTGTTPADVTSEP